jgi:hypothetical protein
LLDQSRHLASSARQKAPKASGEGSVVGRKLIGRSCAASAASAITRASAVCRDRIGPSGVPAGATTDHQFSASMPAPGIASSMPGTPASSGT